MRLKERVAIVTGGNTGIGKAIALAFAREGAHIVLADCNPMTFEVTAGEIRSLGRKPLTVVTDVAREAQVKVMVEQTVETFGRIDILVNNAGIAGPTANLIDLSLVDWDNVMMINLTGPMLCSREVLRFMIPQHNGNIINISSVAAKLAMPMRSPYCASKLGLLGLTQSLALEVGKYNIRVNAICPGSVTGGRMERVWQERAAATGTTYEEQVQEEKSVSPLGRLITGEDVAKTAVFLASDECSETGQVLNVSVGVAMH